MQEINLPLHARSTALIPRSENIPRNLKKKASACGIGNAAHLEAVLASASPGAPLLGDKASSWFESLSDAFGFRV